MLDIHDGREKKNLPPLIYKNFSSISLEPERKSLMQLVLVFDSFAFGTPNLPLLRVWHWSQCHRPFVEYLRAP